MCTANEKFLMFKCHHRLRVQPPLYAKRMMFVVFRMKMIENDCQGPSNTAVMKALNLTSLCLCPYLQRGHEPSGDSDILSVEFGCLFKL